MDFNLPAGTTVKAGLLAQSPTGEGVSGFMKI